MPSVYPREIPKEVAEKIASVRDPNKRKALYCAFFTNDRGNRRPRKDEQPSRIINPSVVKSLFVEPKTDEAKPIAATPALGPSS